MKTKSFRLFFIVLYTVLFLGRGLQLLERPALNYPVYFLLFILGILAYQKELKEQLFAIWSEKKPACKTLLLYFVLAFLLTILFNSLSMLVKVSLGLAIQGQNDANIQKSLAENPYLMLIFSCFIGPVVEEIFFRRFLLGSFFAKLPNLFSLVLTTVLFATLHMHSWALSEWVTAISYLGLGFLFSLLYLKKDKNICYPIIIHSCTNLLAFIITLLFIRQ